MTKTCTKCKTTKSLDAFTQKISGGYFKLCNPCRKRAREYMQRKPRHLFITTPELSAKRPLYVHGISQEQYDTMLEAQDHLCFICRIDDGKRLHIDHCHNTGIIRGLLCTRCNQGIGCLRDSPDNLRKAIEYLERDYSDAPVHRLFKSTA